MGKGFFGLHKYDTFSFSTTFLSSIFEGMGCKYCMVKLTFIWDVFIGADKVVAHLTVHPSG